MIMRKFILHSILSAAVLSSFLSVGGERANATSMVPSIEPLSNFIGPLLVSLDEEPLVAKLQAGNIANVTFKHPKAIYEFYKARDFEPFWTNGSRPSSRARDALAILKKSDEHGLNPDNYAVDTIQAVLDNGFEDAGEFELLLSEAVIRYGQDMTGIRVRPSLINEDPTSWRSIDALNILNLIDQEGDVEDAMHKLAPQDELYKKLKAELKKTRDDLKAGSISALSSKKFPGILRVGQSHPVIADIRKILGVKASGDKNLYDQKLLEAVKDYQHASGIKNDGMVGARTFTALQRGPYQKLIQIIATMERLRWMPREQGSRYILVNIPRQMLELVDKGTVQDTIPVIVGKPERPTQDFIAHITGVRFNPSWHVPPTIKTEDLLPALQKSPDALKKKNLELVKYTSDGATPVDPKSIDWKTVTVDQMKSFGMVQDPGDKNPLGRIRVLMPNRYDIYLHDTNTPELFAKDYRALSSGCVRVGDPKKLASFILKDRENWSDERMNEILATTKTKEIPTDNMPVYVVYQTIWQEGGSLILGPDIYDADVKLVNALASAQKLPQSLTSEIVK